jgi:GTPase SAR1 family protein
MQSVNKWANDDVARILVGNKADSVEQQIVAASEGEKLARELGMEFFQTSAKNGTNVDTVFMTLANTMLKIGEKKEKQREDMIKIQEATVAAERKKGCC